MTTSTITIASSHGLFREAIEHLIKSPRFTISTRDMTFSEVLRDASTGTRPDLIISIVDPDQNAVAGLESLKQMRDGLDNMKIILLMPPERQVALSIAVQSGVDAVLTTKVSGVVLRHVIELVLLDQRVLGPEIISLSADEPGPRVDAPPPPIFVPSRPNASGRVPVLSTREREILRGLVSGCSNKGIARELAITEATVKVHMKALLRKIQTTNRTQAAIWAMNNGLVAQTQQQWNSGTTLAKQPQILLPARQSVPSDLAPGY